MKKFNDLNIRTRVSLILGLVFVFILSTMGIYSYQLNKKRRIAATETSMNTNIQDANHLINTQIKVNQEKLNYAIKYATEEFYKGDYKQINPIFGNILINNKYKKSPPNSGKVIINDKAYRVSYNKVDKIKEMTGAEVTIFQKREEGYLRVATTLKDNYGKRLINTYLANSADLMQNMQRGKSFNRITNILDRNYLGIYSPIKINGKVKGIIFVGTLATDFSKLKSILKDKSYFESGYIFMMSKAGKILLHPTLEGKNVSETNLYKKVIQSTKKEGKIQYLWPEKEGKQKVLYYKYNEAIESYIAITYDYEIWLSYLTSIIKSTSITVFLGVSILLLLLILVLKNVIVSLKKGVDFAGQVADGNLNATMDINQNDEIGMLAKSLNRMVEKLKEIVEGVNSGAGNIASASNQMSSNSQQLSQGASEQASSVEEVSSSMEEMVSNIQQNTDNAKETEKIANSASQGISEVNKLSNESLESIRKIADKIGIINDIAFQTNILALNAAVEAARAGEHGKGFAVVASEVRKLAEKSKIAAEDIVNLTKNSVKVTENSGVVLAKVIPDVEKTSNLIQEIAGASMEQKAGSDQINNAIQQLNQVTQQNAASSEELATSSEELLGQSETLKEQINYFQVKKDNYSINKKEQQANDKENHIKNPISIDKKNKEVKSNPKEGIDLKMFDNDNINDDDYEKF